MRCSQLLYAYYTCTSYNVGLNEWFLSASLRHIRLSAWNNLDPTGGIVIKFDIWVFLKNLSKKFNLYSKLTIIKVLYIKPMYIYNNLAQFFLEWAKFQTKVVEKIKHILCSITFSENYAVLLNNVEKYCRAGQATDDNIRRRKRDSIGMPDN
jgi:hypothetical protein